MDTNREIDAQDARAADKPARDAEPRGPNSDPRRAQGAVDAPQGDGNHDEPPGADFLVSEALGVPLLLDDPAPLSSALHIPTLVDEEKPAPEPALPADNPSPLSSALHIPTLVDEENPPRKA